MAAKAVIVIDGNGNALLNAEVTLVIDKNINFTFPLTNSDGYSLSPFSIFKVDGYIKVVANGYKNYLQLVSLDDQNQEIYVGGDPNFGPPNTIHLPPFSFSKPSRDSIINVTANFCNLYDAQGLPIFEDFIDSLIVDDPARAEDWVRILKANGSTHITLTLSGDYPEPLGWIDRYPIVGRDWTNDLLGFSQCLDWIQSRNLIPIVKLAMDGQSYDSNGLTYGWRWGMDNIPNILNDLSKYWGNCLWSTGFDGCFPVWTPRQTIDALKMLRGVLGGIGNIDTEFGGRGSISYSHLGNGAADWADDKLGLLDCFSLELQTNPAQADGISQTATRLLGPSATNCPVEPYYLANTTKKINICFFETIAYWFIHKQTDDYKTSASLGKFYGFTSFGNGLPE